MNDEVKRKVIEAIAEATDYEPGDITVEDRLLEDLGMDSLDFARLEQEIQERIEIEVDAKAFEGVRTVGELLDKVAALANAG